MNKNQSESRPVSLRVSAASNQVATRQSWFMRCICALFLMAALSGTAWAEKININTADAEALQYIPGIGPSKSVDIIALREANNGFKNIEDLLAVRGIGEKTLQTIREHAAIDSGVSSLTEEMRANPPKKISKSKTADSEQTAS